jgi:hypothetical protein
MKLLKLIIAVIAIGSMSNTALSQGGGPTTRNYGKEADNLWASGAYAEAADAFKKASEKVNPKKHTMLTCLLHVTNCYMNSQQPSNSMKKQFC